MINILFNLFAVNCTVPEEPFGGTIVYMVDGIIVSYERLNETVEETTVLTYQCDSGLSLTGPNTISCTNAGVWSTEPREILCIQTITTTELSELATVLLQLFIIVIIVIIH